MADFETRTSVDKIVKWSGVIAEYENRLNALEYALDLEGADATTRTWLEAKIADRQSTLADARAKLRQAFSEWESAQATP